MAVDVWSSICGVLYESFPADQVQYLLSIKETRSNNLFSVVASKLEQHILIHTISILRL